MQLKKKNIVSRNHNRNGFNLKGEEKKLFGRSLPPCMAGEMNRIEGEEPTRKGHSVLAGLGQLSTQVRQLDIDRRSSLLEVSLGTWILATA